MALELNQRFDKNIIKMQSLNNSNNIFTADTAKNLVFEHWVLLKNLANKRFPNDTEMSGQALGFVLFKLEEQDWQRIRDWDGEGSFTTFLAVLTARQMIDFAGSRFGCYRPPIWLQQKNDPLWHKAFRFFAVEKYHRSETLEALSADASEMSVDDLEEIVDTVYSKCTNQARFSEDAVGINQIGALITVDADLTDTAFNNNRLIEILMEYIQSEVTDIDGMTDARVKDLLNHLKKQINMSDEDRLILRLKFCEGLKIKEIVQKLHLEGGVYLRINALLDDLKKACQQDGMSIT
jgi:hypothetical protein